MFDFRAGYSFDDGIETEALLQFLSAKNKRQALNFLAVLYGKKKDRGRQKEKFYKLLSERQNESRKVRSFIKQFAAEKSETELGRLLNNFFSFGRLLGMDF